jgi:hypothetical protein
MNARVLLIALLAGCTALPVDLTATRDSWQGARYETVVALWGVPTRSAVLADGSDAHTWVSESVGGTWYPFIGVFGGSRGGGAGAGMTMGGGGGQFYRCERTFIFGGGQVVEQSWQGESNYCSTFRRN